ncbi:hypothetical protein NUM3379_04900 [Kineococcus sp. NUM-3379]
MESIVSLAICALLVTVVTAGLVQAVRADRAVRDEAQAADLLRAATESARAGSPLALRLKNSELAGDPHVTTATGAPRATLGALPGDEAVVLLPAAAAATDPYLPHTTTEARQNVTYTVRQYVTQPPAAVCACVRHSALVTWTKDGRERRRWASQLIAQTTRGTASSLLWQVAGPVEVLPATGPAPRSVTVPLSIENHGNRDSWTLSTQVTRAGTAVAVTPSWANRDDGAGVAPSPAFRSTTASGDVTTLGYESGQTARPAVTFQVPAPGATTTYTVTVTMTSTADPTVRRTATTPVTVAP